MNVFLALGTYRFLKIIENKYEHKNMVLMQNTQTAQLWHETTGKTVFASPRKYEVIASASMLTNNGFISFSHIPVRDEGRPVFEYEFTNRVKLIEKEPGFIAMRLLRPLSSDTYVLMTMWEDRKAYDVWQNSDAFLDAHSIEHGKSNSPFSGSSHVSTFFVTDEEIDFD